MGFDTLIMGMRDADKLRELFNIPESETVKNAFISKRSSRGQPVPPLTPPYVPFGIRRFNLVSKHVFQDSSLLR